ncbi:MAG: acyl-CoA thioesterase [Cellvibrionaceae bacterium]
MEVTAEDSDIDSYQHVNNSVYVRWFDECAREHSKAVGVDIEIAAELGSGMAVRESKIQYLRSAYLGDRIQVANWIVKNDGRLRATRHFQLIRESDGVTLVRAILDYVCIDIASGKPSRMPKLFRDRYCDVRENSSEYPLLTSV